jgi:hypothetical protein
VALALVTTALAGCSTYLRMSMVAQHPRTHCSVLEPWTCTSALRCGGCIIKLFYGKFGCGSAHCAHRRRSSTLRSIHIGSLWRSKARMRQIAGGLLRVSLLTILHTATSSACSSCALIHTACEQCCGTQGHVFLGRAEHVLGAACWAAPCIMNDIARVLKCPRFAQVGLWYPVMFGLG